jgi:histone deacetylase 11
VTALSPVFVYSKQYTFVLPPGEEHLHLFDGAKFQRAVALLEERGVSLEGRIREPVEVTREELELVHDRAYLDSLGDPAVIAGILEVESLSEVPIDVLDELALKPMRLATGGTILAVRRALECGVAINLSGGYHHAKRLGGEGFCVYSDIAVAIEVARRERDLGRVMVVDLDVHQGNGVESIYKEDEGVAVFDMYSPALYPWEDVDAWGGIRWEFQVRAGTGGPEYVATLEEHLPTAIEEFGPELIVYNAGTDIFEGDPLGDLLVDEAHVLERDRFVIQAAVDRGIPLAMVPSGGYAEESHRLLANALELVAGLGGEGGKS